MSRAYHKSWQSDRPLKKNSRRVKWYEGPDDIRLEFMDEDGKYSMYFDGPDMKQDAQGAYDAFIAGLISVRWMLPKQVD